MSTYQWDQPATGATLLRRAGRPSGEPTIDRYVRDGIAVTEWLDKQLVKDRIVLLGTSWGGMLGVEMVQERPDLYSAYVEMNECPELASEEGGLNDCKWVCIAAAPDQQSPITKRGENVRERQNLPDRKRTDLAVQSINMASQNRLFRAARPSRFSTINRPIRENSIGNRFRESQAHH